MSVKYSGVLKNYISTELTHESNAIVKTTAPKDNGGDGSLFSPTDLFSVSLGACGATTMGLYAKNHGIELEAVTFTAEKEMSPKPPRRVQKITVHYSIKSNCDDEQFKKLIASAKACPVRNSLSADVTVVESFTRLT